MNIEEYLKNGPIDNGFIASKMWPTNKNAKVYLSKKLNGERPFTDKDAENALKVLDDIIKEIKGLSIT